LWSIFRQGAAAPVNSGMVVAPRKDLWCVRRGVNHDLWGHVVRSLGEMGDLPAGGGCHQLLAHERSPIKCSYVYPS
jgi:hypothetical protein